MEGAINIPKIVNLLLVGFAATLWLCSCSLQDRRTSDNLAAMQALKQRGLLLVSETDDFLAQNVLVADMAGNSKEVAKLIAARGYPKAVEVLDATPDGTRINFYFVEPIEVFEVLCTGSSAAIFGPLQLSQNDKASVAEKLSLYNSEQVAQPTSEEQVSTDDNTKSDFSFVKSLIAEARADNPQAILEQPLDDRGNLIHQVRYSSETLRALALWYTMERANTARIARINKLSESARLNPGDRITIPKYMLKNRLAISEQALSSLLASN